MATVTMEKRGLYLEHLPSPYLRFLLFSLVLPLLVEWLTVVLVLAVVLVGAAVLVAAAETAAGDWELEGHTSGF